MRVYYDRDSDLNLIKGKKVAVVGYGSQGHAHLLNMRDSGVKDIAAALRAGSPSAKKAEAEGVKVMSVADAAQWADIVMMLTPDELQADIYRHELAPNMKKGAALMFAHGLNIHFNQIEPRPDLDILMVAPKGPGHTVRSEYKRGGGVPCLIAINRTRAATPTISASPTLPPSAAGAPASSRRASARNARPISSASKSCCAAASSN